MKRFMIRRVAHCNEGHAQVLDMTENCPMHFLGIQAQDARIEMIRGCALHCLFPNFRGEAVFP